MALDLQDYEEDDEYVLIEWEENFLDTINLTPLIEQNKTIYLSELVKEIQNKYNDQYLEIFPHAAYPLCTICCGTELIKYLVKKYDIDFYVTHDYIIQ